MTYVGCDLHKTNVVFFVLDNNGDFLTRAELPSNEDQICSFLDTLAKPVTMAVECTSSWYWFSDLMDQIHVELKLVHSKMFRAISWAKNKTDKRDSRTLAIQLYKDNLPLAFRISGAERDHRELMRARLRMVARCAALQASLHMVAQRYNVKLPDHDRIAPEKYKKLFKGNLPEAAFTEARLLLDQIKLCTLNIRELEQQIEAFAPQSELLTKLCQLPGLGLVNAYTILTEIGDIHRFPTDKDFTSYCRLVPAAEDSGEKHKHKKGNKDGNRYLKQAFLSAAIHAVKYPVIKQFHQKIKNRSGKYVARTVVAKTLAAIVWQMITKNEPYKGFKGKMTGSAKQKSWPHSINPQN